MKRPTIEEVKERFKNAKKVKCLYNAEEADITKNVKQEIHYVDPTGYWVDLKNTQIKLWGHDKGYAEILTYKEKTFSITESQINNLKKDIKNGYHVDAINYLEKLFPETFQSKVKELKIGTWYNYNGSIVNYQGIENGILQAYGIRDSDKDWMNLSPMGSSPQKWKEATEQ